MNHESKCSTAHGHNYYVRITATASSLDEIGRVIDFGVLKEKVGGWIDTNWDHTFLVNRHDTDVLAALLSMPRAKDPFVCDFNPTAEEMAHFLLDEVCPDALQGTGVTVTKVSVEETSNCIAEASR